MQNLNQVVSNEATVGKKFDLETVASLSVAESISGETTVGISLSKQENSVNHGATPPPPPPPRLLKRHKFQGVSAVFRGLLGGILLLGANTALAQNSTSIEDSNGGMPVVGDTITGGYTHRDVNLARAYVLYSCSADPRTTASSASHQVPEFLRDRCHPLNPSAPQDAAANQRAPYISSSNAEYNNVYISGLTPGQTYSRTYTLTNDEIGRYIAIAVTFDQRSFGGPVVIDSIGSPPNRIRQLNVLSDIVVARTGAVSDLSASVAGSRVTLSWNRLAVAVRGGNASHFSVYRGSTASVDTTATPARTVTLAEAGCANDDLDCEITLPDQPEGANYYHVLGFEGTNRGPASAAVPATVVLTPTDGELADAALPHIIGAIQNTIADNIGERVRNVRNDQNATGLRGFWGVGNSQTLDGENNGVKWDGSLSGFSLGVDTVLASGNLLGIALNRQSGEFDVTKNASSSKYDLSLSTFSPYFGGKIRDLDYHASANLGSGEFGDLDLSSSGVALGGERLFRENRFGEQHFKGDFLYSSSKVGDASFSSGRLRAILEQQKRQTENLRFTAEIGGRLDFGGSSGFGVEAVGGVRHSKGKLAVDGQLRTLLFHSEDISEFGLQVRIQVTPGNDGQGLSLSLTPSYGESESNLENLWEHGISKTVATNRADYALRMNARLGFGLRFPNTGLITPYATARYGDASRFGFGVNWKPKVRDLELDLLGEQSDSQQRILLKGSFGF